MHIEKAIYGVAERILNAVQDCILSLSWKLFAS